MLIKVEDLRIEFQGKIVLDHFNLELEEGEKLGIFGKSGAGKSTILNVILGFSKFDRGKIFFRGEKLGPSNISQLRKEIAWLPQNTSFSDEPVWDFILKPLTYAANADLDQTEENMLNFFEHFNLPRDILNKSMNEISGGERQRSALIACLMLNRKILLLDEPTSFLDNSVKKIISEYIFSLPGRSIITTSHDDTWMKYVDRVIDMNDQN